MSKLKVVSIFIALSLVFASALGAAWTTKRLTNNSGWSYNPRIAVNGANIYVVWYDNTPGNYEIYFRKSLDGGATWQTAMNLSNNADDSYCPAIAVSAANIYVAWHDWTPGNAEIFFRKSSDGGATWQAAKRLTNNSGSSYRPAIAVSGANVYVAWDDNTPGNYEIYSRKSADDAATWQAAKRLTNNTGGSFASAIAVSGANILLTWSDDTPGDSEIYFRKSADDGTTWQSSKRITNNAGNSANPSIASKNSTIYIAWHDMTPGNPEIFFRKSVDGGATWQDATRLTNNSGNSQNPSIWGNDAIVFVAWHDDTPGNPEIFIRKSPDGGAIWQSAQRLTNTSNLSYEPRIAANNSNVYVVWEDCTPGNYEIYLKYSPL